MWPFKKPTVGTLSNVAYARWLRAGSPQPLIGFLVYGEDYQETLAGIGDDYVEDCAETAAGAIAEVLTATIEGLAEGNAGGEGSGDEGDFAAQIAAKVLGAQGPQIDAGAKPGPRAATMGGVTKRRSERIKADKDDRDEPRRLCGLLPDSMRPENEPPAAEAVTG